MTQPAFMQAKLSLIIRIIRDEDHVLTLFAVFSETAFGQHLRKGLIVEDMLLQHRFEPSAAQSVFPEVSGAAIEAELLRSILDERVSASLSVTCSIERSE